MDLRTIRLPEFDGERITVRLRHQDRQRLRRVAHDQGMSKSALVREAISVLIEVFIVSSGPGNAPSSDDGRASTSLP
jgi:hypothetical protein